MTLPVSRVRDLILQYRRHKKANVLTLKNDDSVAPKMIGWGCYPIRQTHTKRIGENYHKPTNIIDWLAGLYDHVNFLSLCETGGFKLYDAETAPVDTKIKTFDKDWGTRTPERPGGLRREYMLQPAD